MEFRKMIDELKPTLKRIYSRRTRFLGFIDADDLYQEALINLWELYKSGQLEDKTLSYILKSCYFHTQNYIRTHKLSTNVVSLEEPIAGFDNDYLSLEDIIVDKRENFLEQLNSRMIVDEIMNNGLTKREKDVFRFLYEGLTLRDAAKRLGISHVRVLKIKQKIRLKYKEKFFK